MGCYTGKEGGGLSRGWAAWSGVLCLLLAGNLLYTGIYSQGQSGGQFGHKYVLLVESLSCLQIASCLLLGLRAGPVLARLLATLAYVERALAHRKTPLTYSVPHIAADSLLRVLVLTAISYVRLGYSLHIYTRSLALFCMFCLSTTEVLNMAILTCLRQSLVHINQNLNVRNVYFILLAENVILEAAKEYRSVTERRLLFRLGTTYLIATMDLYFMIKGIEHEKLKNRLVYHCLATPYNFYEIIIMIYSIHYFCQQTGYLRITLFGLVLDDESYKLANCGRIRAHLNMKNSLTFSAWVFFPLDGTVIHSILASLANYLTILSQFGKSESSSY